MRFQELIGQDLQNRKNQYEKSPNCQPLTPHTKIKVTTLISIYNFLFFIYSFHVDYLLIDAHVHLMLKILFVQ
jgi:hypothetical protein